MMCIRLNRWVVSRSGGSDESYVELVESVPFISTHFREALVRPMKLEILFIGDLGKSEKICTIRLIDYLYEDNCTKVCTSLEIQPSWISLSG